MKIYVVVFGAIAHVAQVTSRLKYITLTRLSISLEYYSHLLMEIHV